MEKKRSDTDGTLNADPDAAPDGRLKNSNSQRLAESIDDANLLMWYASKKGVSDIQKNTLEGITKTTAKYASVDGLTSDDECLFWDSYRMLSKAVAPVSVDSIKATYGDGPQNAQRVIRVYSIFTLITLFFLIALQTYWFVGSNMRTDIAKIKENYTQSRLDSRDLNVKKNALGLKLNSLNKSLDSGGNNEVDENDLNSKINEINGQITQLDEQLLLLQLRVQEEDRMLVSNNTMLAAWDVISELVPDAYGTRRTEEIEKLREKIETLEKQKKTIHEERGQNRVSTDGGKEEFQLVDKNLAEAEKQKKILKENVRPVERTLALRASQSVLAIFNEYILPLLYGLLGALAYILRTLTSEIQNVTYTSNGNVRYQLRWPLGMLAGVTMGWFFDIESLEGAALITPMGLAFLAGYSVELLFTGLDRIVGAFTGPPSQERSRPVT